MRVHDVPVKRVVDAFVAESVESGMPTDKMQRFMDHAQSTVELRKKGGMVGVQRLEHE